MAMANQGLLLDQVVVVRVVVLQLLLALQPKLEHLANGVPEADEVVVDDALSVKVLLAQDADQGQELVHLPQVEYRVVVQLDETRASAIKGGFLGAAKNRCKTQYS